jgi:hypothetical protein
VVPTFYSLFDIGCVHIGSAVLTTVWGFYIDPIGHFVFISSVVSVLVGGVTTGVILIKYYLSIN